MAIAGNDQREALNTSKILLESRGQVETSDLFADSDSMLIIIIIIMEVMQIYTVHWIKRNLYVNIILGSDRSPRRGDLICASVRAYVTFLIRTLKRSSRELK